MVAGGHAERLEVGGVGPGLLVELAVRDGDGVAAHDEGEIVAAVSSGLDPLGQGQHEPPTADVTVSLQQNRFQGIEG